MDRWRWMKRICTRRSAMLRSIRCGRCWWHGPSGTLRAAYTSITTPSQWYSGLRTSCSSGNIIACSEAGTNAFANTALTLEGGVGAIQVTGSVGRSLLTRTPEGVTPPFTLNYRAGNVDGEAGYSAPAGATYEQLLTASQRGVDPAYVRPNGQLIWPPNNGFATPPVAETLGRGTIIDRYGPPENGFFTAPAGTPFEQRALPNSSTASPYYQYEVLRPLPVQSGPAAPAFNQPGGGIQYMTTQSIEDLIASGHLRCIRGPRC